MPAGRPEVGEYWLQGRDRSVVRVESVVDSFIDVHPEGLDRRRTLVLPDFLLRYTFIDLRINVHYSTVARGNVRAIAAVMPNFQVMHVGSDPPHATQGIREFLAQHELVDHTVGRRSGSTVQAAAAAVRRVVADPFSRERLRERQQVMAAEDEAVFAALDAVGRQRVNTPTQGAASDLSRLLSVAADLRAMHGIDAMVEVVLASLTPEHRQLLREQGALAIGDLPREVRAVMRGDLMEAVLRAVRQTAGDSHQGVTLPPGIDATVRAFLARLTPLQQEDLRRSGTAAIMGLPAQEQAALHGSRELLMGVLAAVRDRPTTIGHLGVPLPPGDVMRPDPEPPRLCWDFLDDED